MGNGYSHNYGYNPFMPYGPYYGGYTPHAQFFGPKPQLVHCPTCNQNTKTKLQFITGLNSQLNCILSLLIGFVACSLGLLFLYGFIAKGDTLLLIYFVFCLIVGPLACACSLTPFYQDVYKDAKHYCSVCNNYVGKYIRDPRRPVVILAPESYKHKVYQPKNNLLETV
uniref:LITAF domain-containing protein n=1 Tax=Meloidogyne incognita TaxID=6306 RepID=A0A914LDE5_MELIC